MQPDESQQFPQVPSGQPQQVPTPPTQQPSYNQAQGSPAVIMAPEFDQPTEANYQSDTESQSSDVDLLEPVHWQATEYIQREKDQMWFIVFGFVALVLTVIAIFVVKSWTFAVLVPVMAVALLVYTRRPPRLLNYALSHQGLFINDQLYPFAEFKSFSLMHGVDQYLIMLIPTKRFKPAVSINFPEEAGEAIVDMLAARLPMREMQPDLVDRLVRKLHI